MKAGLWIGIGVGVALTLVVAGVVVGGMLINRQVWAGTPAVTPQPGGRWGSPGWLGCGGMGYHWGAAPGTVTAQPNIAGSPSDLSGCPGMGWSGGWGRGTRHRHRGDGTAGG